MGVPLPPADARPQREPEPNRTLPPALQTRRIFYSGFLWEHRSGWVGSSDTRRWCILLGQQLYLGNEPTDTTYDLVPLAEAEVQGDARAGAIGRHAFRLCTKGHGERIFWCPSELEKLMWAVRLEVAILQATPSRGIDADARHMYHKIFTQYPERPVVPCFSPGQLPESIAAPVLAGYVVTKTGDSWLGANWGRRYVTLHDCWFSVRTERRSPAGLRVFPLQGAESELADAPSEGRPWAFCINSPYCCPVTLCADAEEHHRRWWLFFEEALCKANPEREAPPGLEDAVAALRGQVPAPREQALSAPRATAR
eukprot:TRINITY_DN5462_c1_g2_i1.p1 TRINITY_DN5462_c1_g2~~TRINITY_DN5462_c1_g2_i1.p1  ORF type:complete len:342 (+),score=97.19 TRINITY_DN5462_c1_g2_i1:94-1026(+)